MMNDLNDLIYNIKTMKDDLSLIVREASLYDCPQHKQWFIEQIAKRLNIELPGINDRLQGVEP